MRTIAFASSCRDLGSEYSDFLFIDFALEWNSILGMNEPEQASESNINAGDGAAQWQVRPRQVRLLRVSQPNRPVLIRSVYGMAGVHPTSQDIQSKHTIRLSSVHQCPRWQAMDVRLLRRVRGQMYRRFCSPP